MPQSFANFSATGVAGGSDTALQAVAIRDLCDLAQALADARSLKLVLTSPDMEPVAAALKHYGLPCRFDPEIQITALPRSGPYRLQQQGAHASDALSVGLPLIDAGAKIGRVEFEAARHDAITQRFSPALMLAGQRIARHLAEVRRGRPGLAQRMLALIEAVTEHDDAAASRVMTGLLRLAAGTVPSMVEVTALRIAGLAELVGPRVVLTAEGRETLERAAVEAQQSVTVTAPLQAADGLRRQPLPVRPRPEWKPFARLTVAETNFDIGEAGEYEPLAYRPSGADAGWTELRHELADGWTDIAAEILGATHDTLTEYARMHMIRRRDLPLDEIAEIYDLHGLVWMVRRNQAGYEACIAGNPWEPMFLHVEPAAVDDETPAREIAIGAMLQLWPDVADRLGHDLRSWARRMAAGAKVTPILSPAAA